MEYHSRILVVLKNAEHVEDRIVANDPGVWKIAAQEVFVEKTKESFVEKATMHLAF